MSEIKSWKGEYDSVIYYIIRFIMTGNKLFISFEGIDGAGKSIQISLLIKWLKEVGLEVGYIKGHKLIDELKEKLVDESNGIDSTALFFLSLAKRRFNSLEIEENRIKNDIIVIDRYIDTTVAYFLANQKHNKVFSQDVIRMVYNNNFFISPDLTIFINTTPDLALLRKKTANILDALEYGPNLLVKNIDESFLNNQAKALEYFMQVIRNDKKRFFIVNGNNEINVIQTKIRNKVIKLIEANHSNKKKILHPLSY